MPIIPSLITVLLLATNSSPPGASAPPAATLQQHIGRSVLGEGAQLTPSQPRKSPFSIGAMAGLAINGPALSDTTALISLLPSVALFRAPGGATLSLALTLGFARETHQDRIRLPVDVIDYVYGIGPALGWDLDGSTEIGVTLGVQWHQPVTWPPAFSPTGFYFAVYLTPEILLKQASVR